MRQRIKVVSLNTHCVPPIIIPKFIIFCNGQSPPEWKCYFKNVCIEGKCWITYELRQSKHSIPSLARRMIYFCIWLVVRRRLIICVGFHFSLSLSVSLYYVLQASFSSRKKVIQILFIYSMYLWMPQVKMAYMKLICLIFVSERP